MSGTEDIDRGTVERRIQYEIVKLPEGWRRLDNSIFDEETGDLRVFITNAPRGEMWFRHGHRWERCRRYFEERWVGPWTRVDEPDNASPDQGEPS